jgi:DNA-binding CsgD family transcriptional regulator
MRSTSQPAVSSASNQLSVEVALRDRYALARQQENPRDCLQHGYALGQHLYYSGRHVEALDIVSDLLPAAEAIGDSVWQARLKTSLGICLSDMGIYEKALYQLYQAIVLLERDLDQAQLSRAFNSAAATASQLKQREDAIRLVRAGYRCGRGVNPLSPVFLVNLSIMYDADGQSRRAYRLAKLAVSAVQQAGLEQRWHGAADIVRSKAALNIGRVEEACICAQRGARTFRRCGDQRERCIALIAVARSRNRAGRTRWLRALLESVAATAERMQLPAISAEARSTLDHLTTSDAIPAATPTSNEVSAQATPEVLRLLAKFEVATERAEVRRLRQHVLSMANRIRSNSQGISFLNIDAAGLKPKTSALGWRPPAPFEPLTPRELCVVKEALSGATNKQIATVLGISPGTVRNHLSSAMFKLQVQTRGQLIARMLASNQSTTDRAAV